MQKSHIMEESMTLFSKIKKGAMYSIVYNIKIQKFMFNCVLYVPTLFVAF